MEIVIIGSGNTATIIGRMLKSAGHKIVQVYGRDENSVSLLAKEVNAEYTTYSNEVNVNAELYILAVSDSAIEEVLQKLRLPSKIIVHTAAALSKNVLKTATDHYGVLYPLQTLKKNMAGFPDVPVLIDASDHDTFDVLKELANSISAIVFEAGDEERLKLHVAAVFCNNFVNHLYVLTEKFCSREGLDFSLLVPLIKETALRAERTLPSEAQTGPAVRNDDETIEKHLLVLNKDPQLKHFYQLFTSSIRHSK